MSVPTGNGWRVPSKTLIIKGEVFDCVAFLRAGMSRAPRRRHPNGERPSGRPIRKSRVCRTLRLIVSERGYTQNRLSVVLPQISRADERAGHRPNVFRELD